MAYEQKASADYINFVYGTFTFFSFLTPRRKQSF
jgi:hypothetical protein